MLNWLDSFFGSVASTIGKPVSDAIHWALHALAGVVFAVFGLVGKAWDGLDDAFVSFHAALNHWSAEVIDFATYVVKVLVPRVVKWAGTELAKLASLLAQYYHDLNVWVDNLIRRIEAAIATVTAWALTHIYDPLKSYADQIWADLKKWGFTAWWWITHLQDLADAMIFNIAASLEKNAWKVARMLGTFTLSLVVANVRQLITVIEDIITAVL